jgi:hypothetical protein
VAVAPRVTLESMRAKIKRGGLSPAGAARSLPSASSKCQNGFGVVGEGAPAGPKTSTPSLARKFQRAENAINNSWKLERVQPAGSSRGGEKETEQWRLRTTQSPPERRGQAAGR